ncbi:DNRLRE domain-containing protein [Luteolibacter sp. SL250]|uniref:DNRLRE domain-containing protein n=1 Tax=Luteolibacter sp. SL250 TaxID=2995170 RepID=UPI00226ECF86|nr:DNRLRE domain-containing protein [Luteolibacter sp. SL250]WAC18248.1 DNRLRE domain-containing protein [Luteolibacter sp. SL250]
MLIGTVATLLPMAAGAASLILQQGVSPATGYVSSMATIRSDFPSNNYGAGTYGLVGSLSGANLRTVFGFSLADIPAGSTITSISLTIRGERNDTNSVDGAVDFNLHQLTRPFVEGTGNVNGSNDVDGGVRWNAAQSGTPWTANGGDYNSLILSTVSADPGTVDEVLYTFSTSSAFVAAAQAAFEGGNTLDMLMKMSATYEGDGSRRVFFFHSDDATDTVPGDGITPDSYYRPFLTVEYVPEPGVAILGALGGGLLLGRRRK